ncbi:Zinc finger, CCHC-type [Parasponia andersonii]|uniref:Zinc finger, CCHC-type n=1 Tax=Parasponia andersonii TaxID=3476 RepID=A0A2P5AXR9_PARAD|nr:Zinc finger, CCHC-type [Parasponia andersonii]
MTKSLANRLHMKQRLHSFKMNEEKSISDQIDKFNKIIDDLENIEIKLEDEDKALILLNALPKAYEHFKDAMLYGREQTITLDEVQSAVKAKELPRKKEGKEENTGEGLMARGRSEKCDNKAPRNESRSKSKGRLKCFHCHKEGHFKRDCPDRKKKVHEKPKDPGEASVASDGYDSAEVLVVTDEDSSKEWIMDSGCSFHMCPTKSWFENLEKTDGGSVLLGNNKPCKVAGIGSVRIRMFDGMERILQQVRYVPELKRNLISLGMLDMNGYSFKAEHGSLKVSKGSLIVRKGIRKNGL